jgi:hypothetical protein
MADDPKDPFWGAMKDLAKDLRNPLGFSERNARIARWLSLGLVIAGLVAAMVMDHYRILTF